MASGLRHVEGTLEILDQTRLPAEEVWLRCADPAAVADAILRLAVRGAPAIGIAGAYGLVLALRDGALAADAGAAEIHQRFDAAFDLLAATRPTAVNLRHALDAARLAFDAAVGSEVGPTRSADVEQAPRAAGAPSALRVAAHEAVLAAARAIERDQIDADRRMAEHGLELFRPGDRVLTHCNTGGLATGGQGTAGGVIEAAWRAGRLAHVWVDETRPLLQGARLTAWELARAGVPFQLVTDSSVGTLMSRGLVDRVIVGADRIAANGDVANKIGTYTVAALAHRHDVPFYVAAPRSTLDPCTAAGRDIVIEQRDPAEVTTLAGRPVAPAGVNAANWAFDVTPNELVGAIVTEVGVLRPPYADAIARALDR